MLITLEERFQPLQILEIMEIFLSKLFIDFNKLDFLCFTPKLSSFRISALHERFIPHGLATPPLTTCVEETFKIATCLSFQNFVKFQSQMGVF